MSFEQISYLAQIVASIGVIVSLLFVGLQIKQNTADQLRLEHMLGEHAWAAFHIWDRTQRGIFPQGTFEAGCGAVLLQPIKTPVGQNWWRGAKTAYGFPPPFVADVDGIIR